MPTVKVENKTNDDIIVALDGKEVFLHDVCSTSFENCEKGKHTLTVKRMRIPKESVDIHSSAGPDIKKMSDSNPVSHVQLESEITFEVIASKSVINVIQNVEVLDTLHEDVLFASYRADISGAKNVSFKDRFANRQEMSTYKKQQIKGAFLPVGLIGILVTLAGLFCIFLNVGGYNLKIAGNSVTTPYSLLLLAGGATVFIFFLVSVNKIKKRIKELS